MKKRLVEKLFHSTCTEEELKTLFNLIQKDPSPPEPELMDKLWEGVQGYTKLREEVFERIFSKALFKLGKGKEIAVKNDIEGIKVLSYWQKRRKLSRIASIAASVLFLAAIGIWLTVDNNTYTIIQTAFGERQNLELPDGSKVQLNANSQMVFSTEWEMNNTRKILLEGEAFFEVEKKPQTQQKFQVITDDLVVEVLGTTFNVNNYGDETRVYLEEGSIRLYLNILDSTILMEPGDLIIYSQQNQNIIKKQKEQTELHTSWKDGVLTFKDATLQVVLQKIEDTYGVKFKVMNEDDYSRKINFPLPIDELKTAIFILEKTMEGLEIRKEGNLYIID